MNNDIKLKIKLLYKDSKVPIKAYETDSGFDLFVHNFKRHYKLAFATAQNGQQTITEFELKNKDITILHDKDNNEYVNLHHNERLLVGTGIAATAGKGYEIQLRPRSGLALKYGLTLANAIGTVDESFRNEIGLIILNTSFNTIRITKKDKIAQLVVCPVLLPEIELVDELDVTDRNKKGFGSTGEK